MFHSSEEEWNTNSSVSEAAALDMITMMNLVPGQPYSTKIDFNLFREFECCMKIIHLMMIFSDAMVTPFFVDL